MKPVLLIVALLVSVVAILSSPALCYDSDYEAQENAEVIAPGFVEHIHHPVARVAGRSIHNLGPIVGVACRVVVFPAKLIQNIKPLRKGIKAVAKRRHLRAAVKGGRLIWPPYRGRCCRR